MISLAGFFSSTLSDDGSPWSAIARSPPLAAGCAGPLLASSNSALSRAISACNAVTDPQVFSLSTAVFVIILARCANVSVEIVSDNDVTEGLTVATRHVLLLPPNESLRRKVNFESLNCTCFGLPLSRSTSELITLPRTKSELLIMLASFNRSPSVAVVFCRSLPARSTNVNLEWRTLLTPFSETTSVLTFNTNTACERDDTLFMFVAATLRLAVPQRNASIASEVLATSHSYSPSTYTPFAESSLTDSPLSSASVAMLSLGESKSYTRSLYISKKDAFVVVRVDSPPPPPRAAASLAGLAILSKMDLRARWTSPASSSVPSLLIIKEISTDGDAREMINEI